MLVISCTLAWQKFILFMPSWTCIEMHIQTYKLKDQTCDSNCWNMFNTHYVDMTKSLSHTWWDIHCYPRYSWPTWATCHRIHEHVLGVMLAQLRNSQRISSHLVEGLSYCNCLGMTDHKFAMQLRSGELDWPLNLTHMYLVMIQMTFYCASYVAGHFVFHENKYLIITKI